MAIKLSHHQSFRRFAIYNLSNIIVLGHWYIHRLYGAVLNVVAQHAHHRIVAPSLWILIFVHARIEFVLLDWVARSVIHLQWICLHVRFIPTDKRQRKVVRRPCHTIEQIKLFLINPVGHTVYHIILFSVGSHRHLCTIIKFLDIYIVVVHKGNHASIGRESGNFFSAGFAQLGEFIMTDFINIIIGSKRMTIDCFVIGVKQYFAFVGRHLETAPLRYVAIACRRRIENHLLITRLKRHFHHLIAAAQLIIAFAINRRQNCANAFLTLPQHCIAQGEFLGKYTSHRQQCNNQKYKSLHFVIKNFRLYVS